MGIRIAIRKILLVVLALQIAAPPRTFAISQISEYVADKSIAVSKTVWKKARFWLVDERGHLRLPGDRIVKYHPLTETYWDFKTRRKVGSPRTEKEWNEKGFFTEDEITGLLRLSGEFQKDILTSGSRAETPWGLTQRYRTALDREAAARAGVPEWRHQKYKSDMIEIGKGDVDVWEGSGLTLQEKQIIMWEVFPGLERLDTYTLFRYPTEDFFGGPFGPPALIFRKDGTIKRIPAGWHRK